MKKSDKIAAMVRELPAGFASLDPRYAGYFSCFNAQRYYEAHDVLEDLWLGTPGANHHFYKGLIQLAGAFVHLKKQHERPSHPKDAHRARPAARLFLLAARNLEAYRPWHERLDVEGIWELSLSMADKIKKGGYVNPWTPQTAPHLTLEDE